MQEGLGVPDVVCLVHNNQIELRGRVQAKQALILSLLPLSTAANKTRVEQRKRQDCLRVLLRPFAFEMRLLQAVPKHASVERGELLIKTPHLKLPFALCHQCLWANDQDG